MQLYTVTICVGNEYKRSRAKFLPTGLGKIHLCQVDRINGSESINEYIFFLAFEQQMLCVCGGVGGSRLETNGSG